MEEMLRLNSNGWYLPELSLEIKLQAGSFPVNAEELSLRGR